MRRFKLGARQVVNRVNVCMKSGAVDRAANQTCWKVVPPAFPKKTIWSSLSPPKFIPKASKLINVSSQIFETTFPKIFTVMQNPSREKNICRYFGITKVAILYFPSQIKVCSQLCDFQAASAGRPLGPFLDCILFGTLGCLDEKSRCFLWLRRSTWCYMALE